MMIWETKMRNDSNTELNPQQVLESIQQKIKYLESILGKAKELSPEELDEFETKFHNAVRMRRWVD
jgi:hypothetical protein